MRSTNLPLFDLFQRQRRYVVPLFQRPYVWSLERQWEPLWDDIADRAEDVLASRESRQRSGRVRSHFLGAIVLDQVQSFGRQVPTDEVIDGQQRLTTLQVLLAAFRDVARGTEDARLADDLRMLTENSGVMDSPVERFKVWPTNVDRKEFEAVMTAGSPQALDVAYPLVRPRYARKPLPRPRLVEAYTYFHGAITAYAAGTATAASAERLHALYEAIRRHLQVVVIELEEADDAQLIFETLNARGEPLLPSDLVKNFLFTRAARDGADTQALYDTWWREYDERGAENNLGPETRFWKRKERQGRMVRTRLDLFLFHFVAYRTCDDLHIGHLFDAFRDWWKEVPDRRVEDVLQDLRRHSDVFAGLFVPDGESRTSTFARRLQRLDTSTVYPLLLFLLVGARDRVDGQELDGIVEDLESYLVRRTVCRMTTQNYNRFFLKVLEDLAAAPVVDRATFRRLLGGGVGQGVEWPDDARFERAWLEEPVYDLIATPKLVMILEAIEKHHHGAKQEAVTVHVDALTIEHVMPQRWQETWPEPATREGADESAEDHRNRMINTFGNLTLLTQALNSSVSNGPYAEKRPEIARQSLLRMNAWFQSEEAWDEEAIRARGRALFQHARAVWPHPGTG